MAGNTIDINLSVQDQGKTIQGRTNDAKRLNDQLERAQNLMRGTGTKTGNQAARRAGYMGPEGPEVEDYNRSRGVAGGGGASGRDFADQARGLGGLVRLYATYAANLFAVAAGFNALREAMNTEIMIRGLDQLGAASGIAMGGLAKQFAAASDGAISLREAMEATAKAVSSGLTTQQFMQLGEVAKGASQALGVGMSDAVSRLTRGITKLEPELLDELGIFTKVGKSAEEYARTVGKSESALTDFERRQAFANAVLKEGREKFGEIAQEGNPYDKLLASLKNVAQDILTIVNAVVGPIAKLLAENTSLIGVAIAAAALKITKQALPALGEWQSGLKKAAEVAEKRAGEINTAFAETFVGRAAAKTAIPVLDKQLEEAKQKVLAAQQEIIAAAPKDRRVTGSKSFAELTKAESLELDKVASYQQKINDLKAKGTQDSTKYAAAIEKRISAEKEVLRLTEQIKQEYDKINPVIERTQSIFTEVGRREQALLSARQKAADLSIRSRVSENVDKTGMFGAIKTLYSETRANKDIGTIGKFKTVAIGTVQAVAREATIMGQALSSAFAVFQVFLVGFAVLDTLFSTNKKAVQEFDSSISQLEEATKTATAVNEKFKNSLTVDSINAYANSFEGVADALDRTVKAFIRADQMSSWIDKTKDFLSVFIGGQRSKALGENLVESITTSIEAMPKGPLREALASQLQGAVGTADLSVEGLTEQLKGLTNSLNDKELASIANQVGLILKDSKKALKDAQAVTQDVRETAKASQTSFQNLANSVKDNSPVTVFLANTVKQAVAVDKALQDVIGAQGALNELSKQGGLEFLDPTTARQMASLLENYKQLNSSADMYNDTLVTGEKRLKEIDKYLSTPTLAWNKQRVLAEKDAIQANMKAAEEGLQRVKSGMDGIAQSAQALIKASIGKQIDESLRIFGLKMQQLAIDQQKAILSKYPVETKETIKQRTELELQSVKIQGQLTEANLKLVMGIELLRIQVQRDADLREIENIKVQQADKETSMAKREELVGRENFLQERISKSGAVEKAASAMDFGALQKLAKDDPSLMSLVQQLQGIAIARKQTKNQLALTALGGRTDLIKQETKETIAALENDLKRLESSVADIYDESAQGIAAKANIQTQIIDKSIELIRKRAEGQLEIAKEVAKEQEKTDPKKAAEALKSEEFAINLERDRLVQLEQRKKAQLEYTSNLAVEGALQKTINERTAEQYSRQIEASKLLADAENSLIELTLKDLEYQQSILDKRKEAGQLTDEQYRKQNLRLQLLSIEANLTKSILKAQQDRDAAALELARDMAAADTGEDVGGAPAFMARGAAIGQAYTSATTEAIKFADQQRSILGFNQEISSQAMKLGETFEQQFSKAGDALYDFITTGKFSFKDFTTSILNDFLRLMIRMQTEQMITDLGGKAGFAKMFSSFFGFSAMGNAFNNNGIMKYANGGVFSLPGYAKGGTFTNSIVNQPTLFKAAKGLGVMGEAGPEAIMPLKRDSSGNLGVSGAGSNVEVVVNNYGKEQATARETTDGRGNRRIEVTVGDMVAGELGRTNSSLQKSFTNTYGLSSMVGRR